MISLIDLFQHQFWADNEHWKALAACPGAASDQQIRDRLHHIHHVQHAFLWTVKRDGTPFHRTTPGDFSSLPDLISHGRRFHADAVPFVAALAPAALADQVSIVWFKDPPLTISVEEALTQCAMHSHYHRGQNATRLRELGGEPPLTDFIVWLWKGKPAAALA
jgi:uncharacterized damage-inducible protein DinB